MDAWRLCLPRHAYASAHSQLRDEEDGTPGWAVDVSAHAAGAEFSMCVCAHMLKYCLCSADATGPSRSLALSADGKSIYVAGRNAAGAPTAVTLQRSTGKIVSSGLRIKSAGIMRSVTDCKLHFA